MARTTKNLDDAVEMALYTLAVGARASEKKEIYKDGHLVESVFIEKQLPPDLKAIQLWLSVKVPSVWGDISREDGRVDEILEKLTSLCESETEIK